MSNNLFLKDKNGQVEINFHFIESEFNKTFVDLVKEKVHFPNEIIKMKVYEGITRKDLIIKTVSMYYAFTVSKTAIYDNLTDSIHYDVYNFPIFLVEKLEGINLYV